MLFVLVVLAIGLFHIIHMYLLLSILLFNVLFVITLSNSSICTNLLCFTKFVIIILCFNLIDAISYFSVLFINTFSFHYVIAINDFVSLIMFVYYAIIVRFNIAIFVVSTYVISLLIIISCIFINILVIDCILLLHLYGIIYFGCTLDII